MRWPFLFEFCDQTWVPSSARDCLFEIMEACNSGVRSFNGEIAKATLALARESGYQRIVELGAGRAPITTHLVTHHDLNGLKVVPCDLIPNVQVFHRLAQQKPDCVQPIFEPVDIANCPSELFHDSVLVLAGMMHHVPFRMRSAVLQSLSRSRNRGAMFEPLRRSLVSILLTVLSFFPALLLPITYLHRSGRFRRLFWCWLVPIVPAMFVWDGIVSCMRQWSATEWRREFDAIGASVSDVQIRTGLHSLEITWTGCGDDSDR